MSKINSDRSRSTSHQAHPPIQNQNFKIHGFTAWLNMRLTPYDLLTSDILNELFTGANMKFLIQSFTGTKDEKFSTFDGLAKDQIHAKLKVYIKELQKNQIIPEDLEVNLVGLSTKQPKIFFDLMWRLVCHDIFYLWDRIGYLSNKSTDVIVRVPFTWIPAKPAKVKKGNQSGRETSDMSRLDSVSCMSLVSNKEGVSNEPEIKMDDDRIHKHVKKLNIKYPGFEIMQQYNHHNLSLIEPIEPKTCVIAMINMQLKTHLENGKRIVFKKLSELSDTRVLCGIINSFVPNLFPTEILINDRWCLNLVLRSIDKMLMCDSTLNSDDLVEADPQGICAFICYLFMMFYKFRQCQAVVHKIKIFDENIKKVTKALQVVGADSAEKSMLEVRLHELNFELQNLHDKYDTKYYQKWVERVETVKNGVHSVIINKLEIKFDWFTIDTDISNINLCLNKAINLTLTNGVAFYKIAEKESVSRDRKIILKEKGDNPKFYFNFDSPTKVINKILKLSNQYPIEIDPERYPNIEIFAECRNNNKSLKAGTVYLYQVFPSSISFYHSFLINACHDKNYDAVQRLVEFFSKFQPSFINLKDKNTNNTALHIASHTGNFEIVHYLLDNFADVDSQNKLGETPLFLAADICNRECAKLLLEYGASLTVKNKMKLNVIQNCKNDDYRLYLEDYSNKLSHLTGSLLKGFRDPIELILKDHQQSIFPLHSLRNRFIDGKTILHIAAQFSFTDLVENLLNIVDVDGNLLSPNTRDSKGATALHLTSCVDVIQLLIEYGAKVNSKDLEGNTPLHVMCQTGNLEGIRVLINHQAELTAENNEKALPIHSAAKCGHTEVIQVLFEADRSKKITESLSKLSAEKSVRSTVYLATVSDNLACANWLLKSGLAFKDGEADELLFKVLTDEIQVKDSIEMIKFLCQNSCNLQTRYQGGNTALHYAAMTSGDPTAIKLLIKFGAFVNIINDEMMSPLFNAVNANNPVAVSILIECNADYKIRNNDGHTAFDLIRDIDEWLKCDCFNIKMKGVLKSYEYKQTRNLIRGMTDKIKPDFSMRAKLFKRKREFSKYVHSQDDSMAQFTSSIMLLPSSRLTQSMYGLGLSRQLLKLN